uniref:Beta/gamma crystallin 'Greek key' domain-containing protein n=1 Tax=Terrapene triunguis TaxID=2587831 RepID=A0A674JAN3_9SAUR
MHHPPSPDSVTRGGDDSSFQITAYDQENFQGKKMEFTSACPTIIECGFENIRSLKVESGAWIGYEHTSFCGQQFILERGEYPRWDAWSGSNAYHTERLMSFRPICCAVSAIPRPLQPCRISQQQRCPAPCCLHAKCSYAESTPPKRCLLGSGPGEGKGSHLFLE